MQLLRCPACKGPIARDGTDFRCGDPECLGCYPIIRGVPILINEERSLFRIEDVVRAAGQPKPAGTIKAFLRRLVPRIGHNLRAKQNLTRLAELLRRDAAHPRVLVVGGGEKGEGLEALLSDPDIELTETDVFIGERTGLVCDAHDLPFGDQAFDGVIIQAVLEHVVDPQRCVEEIHRVLKEGGLVYAETPFMQQVHLGALDFWRFSHLGHRRLFRHFTEIESGPACGPGMALAWSLSYFLMSFWQSRTTRRIFRALAALTLFPLKYFDYLVLTTPGAYDAASGYYFLGRRSGQVLTDRDLIKLYRGAL